LKYNAILDQLSSGFWALTKSWKKLLLSLSIFFVHSSDEVSPAFVKSLLTPPVTHDAQVKHVMQMLYSFIQNSSADDLFDFLSFTTGSRSSTAIFVPASIAVSGGNTEAIFASTCTLELKLPYGFASYSEFESSMRANFKGRKKMYTTV